MEVNSCDVIKLFVSSVKEYNSQRSEATANKLQRYLQILSTSSDNSIFDPGNADGAAFYVSLYDLMLTLNSKTGLMWCAISVLEEACENPAAQNALIHKFKFAPILTQLLTGALTPDKQLKVLRLLQEFTYGVVISWQDAHLPLLVQTLFKWINEEKKNSKLVCLSLGVLVNLCYKNLPAVYVLRRIVDTKDFIRSILCHPKDVLDINVLAYKLLIILEEVTGEVTDNEIVSLVPWSFKRLSEAFHANNINAMRHVVDFFKDVKENSNYHSVLCKYQSYTDDSEKLLRLLENVDDLTGRGDCAVLMLEFVHLVVELRIPEMETLYEPLVKLSLSLICVANPRITQAALRIICALMALARRSGTHAYKSITVLLDCALPMILSIVNEIKLNNKLDRDSMAALISLLFELSQDNESCDKILSSLQPAVMKNHFLTILTSQPRENDDMFDYSSTRFYLEALSLMTRLSSGSKEWSELLCEILVQKKLHMRLAAVLYMGPAQLKLHVLKLVACLGTDNSMLRDLSQCLMDLSKLVSPVMDVNSMDSSSCVAQSTSTPVNCTPFLSVAQQTRLDHCIETVQEALSSNQLNNVGTAAVLDLYEYRVAAMSHTESMLQSNLQAVDNHCTQLGHRLSVMTSEMKNLLSVLHNKEQSYGEVVATMNRLQRDLMTSEKSEQNTQSRLSQVLKDVELSNRRNDELKKDVISCKQQISDNLIQIKELNWVHERDLEQHEELKSTVARQDKTINQHVIDYKKKVKELEDSLLVVQNREQQIKQLEGLLKGCEKSLSDKDNELVRQQNENMRLQNEIKQNEATIAEQKVLMDSIMKLLVSDKKANEAKEK